MASSVCGDVGFAPIEVELRVDEDALEVLVREEVVVVRPEGAVVVVLPVGWCRRRNLTLPAVMKQEM